MTWIRSPLWDGFWILSGLPIGVTLLLTCPELVPALAIAIMVLESGHVVSPVIVAWINSGLRKIVCREWIKYIAVPAGLVAGGFVARGDWVIGVYFAWNIYHFGMQLFGVSSLYVRGGTYDSRIRRGLAALGITAVGMGVVPVLTDDARVTMLLTGIFSFNHWLTDIGLSSRVVRWHWGFIAAVTAIGILWLMLRNGPLSATLVPQIIVIRSAVGVIHFIYSARIWKLSDPQVRAAIGHWCGPVGP